MRDSRIKFREGEREYLVEEDTAGLGGRFALHSGLSPAKEPIDALRPKVSVLRDGPVFLSGGLKSGMLYAVKQAVGLLATDIELDHF
jgi:hypothetical protein